jgi:histidinol-phosphate aminotransferase
MTNLKPRAVPGVQKLQPYIPGKPIDELEREYGVTDAVKVASNENPLGPSPKVAAHLAKLISNPSELARYPDGNGFVLKNKLAEKLAVSLSQITIGNGSNDVLELLARAFAGPGDEVIFSQYAFAVYPIITQAIGAAAVITKAQNWGYDLSAILKAITDKTRLIFIANPNNPTGTCLTGTKLKDFINQVPEDVLIVVDEAYEEYAVHPQSGFYDSYRSVLSWLNDYPNLVLTRTFSKAYGLAGLRIGYAVSSADVADVLNRIRQPFNSNSLALEAASIALDDQAYIQQVVDLNWQGMQFLTRSFLQAGLSYIPSAGNFVCVQIGNKSAEIYEMLLYEGVITRPVANYQMPDHLRITVGTMDENQRVISALQKVMGR